MDRRYLKGFRQLIAWQIAHQLTLNIYSAISTFPAQERYGIISQLQRASSSIGAQVAEGSRMPTYAHRKLYYDRAYASTAEVDNFLELAKDLGYLDMQKYKSLLELTNRCSYLVLQLSRSCIKQL